MSQSPLATRHGFSQLAASFFAGRCQGILRVRSSAWSLNAPSARADAVGNPRNRNDPPVRRFRCALHFLSLALLTSNQPPPSTGLAHGSALAEPEDICSAKARCFSLKGGNPAAPSDTATLLRLSPSQESRLRRWPPCGWPGGFGRSSLPWLDGRCVQGPGTYSPRRSDPRLLAIPASWSRVADSNPN